MESSAYPLFVSWSSRRPSLARHEGRDNSTAATALDLVEVDHRVAEHLRQSKGLTPLSSRVWITQIKGINTPSPSSAKLCGIGVHSLPAVPRPGLRSE